MTSERQNSEPRLDNCLICGRTLIVGSIGGVVCDSPLCHRDLIRFLDTFGRNHYGSLCEELNWLELVEEDVDHLTEKVDHLEEMKSEIESLVDSLSRESFCELKKRLKEMIDKLEDFEKNVKEVNDGLFTLIKQSLM